MTMHEFSKQNQDPMVLWLELCSPESNAAVLTLGTLFGNRVFKDCCKPQKLEETRRASSSSLQRGAQALPTL